MSKTISKEFHKCVDMCQNAGGNVEDCIPACGAGMRELYGEHTKMGIGKLSIETTNGTKGWVIMGIFVIVAVVAIVLWLL